MTRACARQPRSPRKTTLFYDPDYINPSSWLYDRCLRWRSKFTVVHGHKDEPAGRRQVLYINVNRSLNLRVISFSAASMTATVAASLWCHRRASLPAPSPPHSPSLHTHQSTRRGSRTVRIMRVSGTPWREDGNSGGVFLAKQKTSQRMNGSTGRDETGAC